MKWIILNVMQLRTLKKYLIKYIKIANDKQVLTYSVSESIDELIEGLAVNSSNDIAAKEIKDFKQVVIESIDKFKLCIKLETKKKDTAKENIEKVNAKKNSEHDANNKPATNVGIKVHIKHKQKIINKDIKVYQKQRVTAKTN